MKSVASCRLWRANNSWRKLRRLNLPNGRTFFALLLLWGISACESFEGVGQTVSEWTSSFSGTFGAYNPLGAEAIAVGRATPEIAGNTYRSAGTGGTLINIGYDFRSLALKEGVIEGKPAHSWLFVDRRLEAAEVFLQIYRIEGATLAEFGESESFFIDRTEVASQMFCVGPASKKTPPLIRLYLAQLRMEGVEVSQHFLVRRFTERRDREDQGHRVDMVYIEDILRSGYTCEEFGNLVLPDSPEVKTFLDSFKSRSKRSFSVMG